MNCPIIGCGRKMQEWGLNTRPIYECPVHGRIRVERPKSQAPKDFSYSQSITQSEEAKNGTNKNQKTG